MATSSQIKQRSNDGGSSLKLLTFVDDNGITRKSLVRDGDTDPSIGLIQSPPNVQDLDWETIAKNIYLKLLERGLFTLKDIQVRNTEFSQVIMSSVVKPIYGLYQEEK
jgi:hypothetical protein